MGPEALYNMHARHTGAEVEHGDISKACPALRLTPITTSRKQHQTTAEPQPMCKTVLHSSAAGHHTGSACNVEMLSLIAPSMAALFRMTWAQHTMYGCRVLCATCNVQLLSPVYRSCLGPRRASASCLAYACSLCTPRHSGEGSARCQDTNFASKCRACR